MTEESETQVDDAGSTSDQYPRLKPFRGVQTNKSYRELGPNLETPWPDVEACLIVLFTARSGSTFLSRELEMAFEVGKMGESLNPPKVKKRALQKTIDKLKGSWFSAKAGVPGIVSGELCGFFDNYINKTSFIRLIRKDIVAQAVSTAKAMQTRGWHVTDRTVATAARYDAAIIANAVLKIDRNVMQLRQYAQLTGRPCLPLVYEDFSNGDLTPALKVGDALGAPRHKSEEGIVARPVERVGDATNEAWIARFTEEMDPALRDRIARYVEVVEDDTKS